MTERYRLPHRPAPPPEPPTLGERWRAALPEPGLMTVFCYVLGIIDAGLIAFIVSSLLRFHR